MIKNFAYGLLIMIPVGCLMGLIIRYPNVLMPIFMGATFIVVTCMFGILVQDTLKDRKKK